MLRSFLKWVLIDAEQRLTRTNELGFLVVLHLVVSVRFALLKLSVQQNFAMANLSKFVFFFWNAGAERMF